MHSAIMALRFHASETDVLPRERLIESMRLALAHPDFADQIVPDLAQWEDWEIMPRLVQMFKDSPVDGWIRRPVASYLLVAEEQPGEVGVDAAAALKELEAIDPKTLQAVRSLSAFGLLAAPTASNDATTASDSKSSITDPEADGRTSSRVRTNASAETAVAPGESSNSTIGDGSSNSEEAITGTDTTNDSNQALAVETRGDGEAKQAVLDVGDTKAVLVQADPEAETAEERPLTASPNRLALIGVPLLAGLVLLAVFAALLRGGDSRPPTEPST
jgi:hypothetical protein